MGDLAQLLQQFGGGGGGGMGAAANIQYGYCRNSAYLLHGVDQNVEVRALGIPMEVMGLMLGEFADDYTVTVVDVFAMPQHGTGVSVEAVDPVFQTKMLDMLKQTARPEWWSVGTIPPRFLALGCRSRYQHANKL